MNPEVEKQSFINPESHKVIYQNEYDRMTEEYDAEYFAWAEDLYNSRIIVYSDKGKNLKTRTVFTHAELSLRIFTV